MKLFRSTSRVVLITALLTCSVGVSAARAQDAFMFDPGTFSNMMMQPNFDRMLKRNMELARGKEWVNQGNASENGHAHTPAVTRVTPLSPGKTAEALAQSYPAGSRDQAKTVFMDLLDKYSQIERQFGIPRRDVAGAVAAFLAGSYMAYHNSDFPDENFPPLVSQIRSVLAANPSFAQAGNAEKQDMYEQFAIIGMLMAGTQMALKENPDTPNAHQIAANMRQAGKRYLEDFLKTEASRVDLTDHGLEIRPD